MKNTEKYGIIYIVKNINSERVGKTHSFDFNQGKNCKSYQTGRRILRMANKTETTALALAEKTAEELGVYIVDVSYKKEGDSYSLCYYIDKEGGVGIDDCEAFSRAIEPVLDEADPIEGNYTLEVSSPGADRRLTKEREFLYYIGAKVDVKLFKPIDGMKEFSGILTGYKDKAAEIEVDGNILIIPVKEASFIRLSFDF